MPTNVLENPVLVRFHAGLDHAYGKPLERVMLFGSRERGDARDDSDYDIAVFLKNFESFSLEAGRLADIETDILDKMGAVIDALPFRAFAYEDRIGLMSKLRRDGRDL